MSSEDHLNKHLAETLDTTFTDAALTQFCFDQFPAVYRRFSTSMSKRQKMRSLITYCEEQRQLDHLNALLGAPKPARPPTQPGQAETRPTIDQATRPVISQRCLDLAEHLRETLSLVKQYEDQRRLSSDPKEKQRAKREIDALRQQLAEYEAEATKLGCP